MSELDTLIERLNDNPTRSDIAQAGKTLLENVDGGDIGAAKSWCTAGVESSALTLVNDAIDRLNATTDLKAGGYGRSNTTACRIVRSR